MSDRRPILYLDVDGVISLFGIKGELAATREIRVEVPTGTQERRVGRPPALVFDGQSHPLREIVVVQAFLAEGIEQRLRRLDEIFEIVWCTGWHRSANNLLEAMGICIGPYEVLRFDGSKLEAIVMHAGERHWAFVDDEVAFELQRAPGAAHSDACLLVETRPEVGLIDEDVDRLLAFAAAH